MRIEHHRFFRALLDGQRSGLGVGEAPEQLRIDLVNQVVSRFEFGPRGERLLDDVCKGRPTTRRSSGSTTENILTGGI